jgi:hypothetical protein
VANDTVLAARRASTSKITAATESPAELRA